MKKFLFSMPALLILCSSLHARFGGPRSEPPRPMHNHKWELPAEAAEDAAMAEPDDSAQALSEAPALPPLPKAPVFSGLDKQPLSIDSPLYEDVGSTLELWLRKEGMLEQDIKLLSQLPGDQKALIRKIVQAYQIDMQRTVLEIRPNYQRILNDIDALKLELSSLILMSKSPKAAESAEAKALIAEITAKEGELTSLQTIQDKIASVFKTEMTDQMADVVNSWISSQASKSKDSLSDLFKDAENTYGLKWEK